MPGPSQPPKNTSGAGFVFEEEVGAWYVLRMLAGEPPFGEALGRIEQVTFQGHVDGWFLDDVVLRLSAPTGTHTVSLSVKSNPQFGVNTAPPDFVRLAWEQVLGAGDSAFSEATDFVGLITTPLPPELGESLEFVQRLSEATPPEDMPRRIRDSGFSSQQRRQLYGSFACPAELSSVLGGSDGRPARLLARARFAQFDFDRGSSERTAQAISACQRLLNGGDRVNAEQLWNAVLSLVREKRPVAGTLTRAQVIHRLQPNYALMDWPDHAQDWRRLEQQSRTALGQVPDLIGGEVALPQLRQVTALEQANQNSKRIMVLGSPGAGKTVAVKRWVMDSRRRFLWVDAADLADTGWQAFEASLGLSYPLEELLSHASVPGVLVIDGLDRTADARAFANAAQLIHHVSADPGAPDPDWTVILPCFDDEWRRVAAALGRTRPIPWTIVPLPTYGMADLQPVWERLPELITFIQDQRLSALVGNLKIVDLVFRQTAQSRQPVPRFVGESDVIDWYWREVIEQPPAALRAELVKALGRQQAESGVARIPRSALPHALLPAVNLLVTEHVCESADERLWFEHELLGDWARLRVLIGMEDRQRRAFILAQLHTPIWHRAVRLYGLRLLERGDTDAWSRERQALDHSGQHAGGDLLLDAVFLAAQPDLFLERLWPELIADRGALFQRMLDRFFILASRPNDWVLAVVPSSAADQRASVAAHYRTAELPRWLPIVLFAERHFRELASVLPNALRRLAQDFMDSAPAGTPGLDQAARIALELGEAVETLPGLSDAQRQQIYATALSAAGILPDEVGAFALMAGGRTEKVVPSPEPEALSPDLPPHLRALRRAAPVRLRRTYVEMRPARPPWPDGPRRRIDEAFRAVVRSDTGMIVLSRFRPAVAREVILAALIEDGAERPAHSGLSEGEPVELISPGDERGPAWWIRGPFSILLQADRTEGLRCILQLVEFATARWAEAHPAVPTIDVLTTGGTHRYLGNPGVYAWYRKHLSGYPAPAHVLTSALSALEQSLYQAVDAGQDISGVIDTLLDSCSVAVLGVLVALVKYHPPLLAHARLLETIAAPEIVLLDRRVALDRYPPLGRPGNPAETEAFRRWITLPHRHRDILEVLAEAFVQEDEIRSRLEQLRSDVIRQAGGEQALPATTRLWAAHLDRENYSIDEGPAWGREFILTLPSEFVAPPEHETAPSVLLLLFVHRCRRILDGEEALTPDQLETFWNELQALQRLIETRSGNHLPLLAGAAVLLRTDPDWVLGKARTGWCQDMLVQARNEATQREPFDPSDVMRMDWDAFAAEGLPILWNRRPEDQALRELVHAVVSAGTPSAVDTLVRGVSHQANLFQEFGRLRHLVVRLAAEREVNGRLHDGAPLPVSVTEFQQRTADVAEQFLTGTLAPDLPDLTVLKSEVHAVLSACGEDVTSWPVRAATIWPAFSWWPSPRALDAAGIERCLIECRQLFGFMLPPGVRSTSTVGSARMELDAPDDQDESILQLAGRLTASLTPAQAPALFWQPLLTLGRDGEAWLIPFLQAFAAELLSREVVPASALETWAALQDATLTVRRSDGQVMWFSSEVLTALMGIDHQVRSSWDARHRPLVARTLHLWQAWSPQGLQSPGGAEYFAWFVRQDAAQPLLPDGLIWLGKVAQTQSTYWWKRVAESVMRLLQFLWDGRAGWPLEGEHLEAFHRLLAGLVEKRWPQALVLAEAAGHLE